MSEARLLRWLPFWLTETRVSLVCLRNRAAEAGVSSSAEHPSNQTLCIFAFSFAYSRFCLFVYVIGQRKLEFPHRLIARPTRRLRCHKLSLSLSSSNSFCSNKTSCSFSRYFSSSFFLQQFVKLCFKVPVEAVAGCDSPVKI